jgi:predicted nucleic acid-binding protein
MNSLITLDTNILIRAADCSSKDYFTAKEVLIKLSLDEYLIVLSPQIIYECWVVLTRPKEVNGMGLGIEEAYSFINETLSYYNLVSDDDKLFSTWFELVKKYDVIGVKAHDARIVAWMLNNSIEKLITFNTKDFLKFPIQVLHPNDFMN